MSEYKRGRLSNQEKQFIKENSANHPDTWIAEQLNRDPLTVGEFRKVACAIDQVPEPEDGDMVIRMTLRGRDDWPMILKQYNQSELEQFEFYWIKLNKQFGELTTTEEMQVLKLIHLELMMGRMLVDKKRVVNKIEEYEEKIRLEKGKTKPDENKVMVLEGANLSFQVAEKEKIKEYRETLDKYNRLLENLKATRDQRLDRIESGKMTIFDWIRLHNEQKIREQDAHEMELMKIAVAEEVKRVSAEHRYDDGIFDQPFLTPDTVKVPEIPDREMDNPAHQEY